METIYIKDGKRYRKIGTTLNTDYMNDGLWLIQSHKNSKEYNNISCRLNKLPTKVDVDKFVKAFLSKDLIIKAVQKLEEDKGCTMVYNISMSDFAEEIVNQIYIESDKQGDSNVYICD